MKKLALTIAGAALLSSAALQAQTQQEPQGVYLGGSVSHYFLDRDRFLFGDGDATTAGLNLGYRLDNPIALELGYGWDAGGEDLDAWTFSTYYYFDRSSDGWAPYLVGSFSSYEFDDESGLVDGDDKSEQLGLGFGVSKTWESQWEFRGGAQLYVLGGDDSYSDLALNLGLNYYFNKPEPEPVARPAPEPEPEPTPPPTRTITVELKVLFEFDKAEVRSMYGDEIGAVANAMKEHDDIELALEGHTDSIGTEAYNQGLSERRVQAVKEKLVADYGIPAHRISTVGYGESRPVADNSTPEGRQQNRRVIGQVTFEEVVEE